MWKKPSNTERGVRTRSKDNRWLAAALICGIFFCAPAGGVLGWRASEAVSDSDIRLFLGIGVATMLFLASSAMLSLFITAYSRLRRTEEDEDDRREMDMMKILLGQRPDTRVNYTIRPGQQLPPYQYPPLYPGGYPSQPVQSPTENAPVIEYVDEDVNLGG